MSDREILFDPAVYPIGSVAEGTIGGERHRVFRRKYAWVTAEPVMSPHQSVGELVFRDIERLVTDVRPMRLVPADAIVLDPHEVLFTDADDAREYAEALIRMDFIAAHKILTIVASQLEPPAPPKPRPDEYAGRFAVVNEREGVGTGAGEGATGQDTGTAWVTRSVDCPEAPAQAHPFRALVDEAPATGEPQPNPFEGTTLRNGQTVCANCGASWPCPMHPGHPAAAAPVEAPDTAVAGGQGTDDPTAKNHDIVGYGCRKCGLRYAEIEPNSDCAGGQGEHTETTCHCGRPVTYGYDGDPTHHRGMCARCDSVRCDAYPDQCPFRAEETRRPCPTDPTCPGYGRAHEIAAGFRDHHTTRKATIESRAAERSVPQPDACLCGGDGVRYTLGAARDCPVHGFPSQPETPAGGDT